MKLEEPKMEILAQHHLIRALLVNLGDVAQRVAGGDASHMEMLRESARQLAMELLRHMADEERLLGELMRAGHVPSALHLEELQHDHVHQRELIASFRARVESIHTTKRLGELVEAMTHAVLLDMEHEESALFGMRPFDEERAVVVSRTALA